MKKNNCFLWEWKIPELQKLFRIMKLTTFLFLISVISVFASKTYSQTKALNLKMSNSTVKEVLRNIEDQSEFYFMYSERLVDVTREVSINIKNAKVDEVLDKIFASTDVKYTVKDRFILLSTPEVSENDITIQQQKTISGKVSDSTGAGLPGASVVVKGTTTGVITDGDGKYTITKVPENATLQFSFVGMKMQEIVVGGKTTIDVVLADYAIGLDEVVVTAYGTQRQREVTGSISKIKEDNLSDIPTGQISQKLQGQIPGVEINQANGIPGQDLAIRIRGAASINAGNEPLYVLDGFPLDGGMSMINPEEIDNISVLKGSSASSLYGSRAANGVVLITTKRAKEGQTIVQFNTTFGVSQVPQKGRPHLMNAKEFLTNQKAFWEDKITYEGYTDGVPELYQNPDAWTGPDTDWFRVFLHNAPSKSYNLSLLSNKGKFSSANILGYYNEEGVVRYTGYERYSLRSNNDYEVNDHLRIGFNIAPTFQIGKNLNTSAMTSINWWMPEAWNGQYNNLYTAIVTPPIFGPNEKNPDGSIMESFTGPGLLVFPNWAKTLKEQKNFYNQLRLLSSVYAELDFLKYFKFRSSFSVDLDNNVNRTFYPSDIGPSIADVPPRLATGSYTTSNSISWLTENTLTFNKTFAKNHNVDALIGYSAQANRSESGGLEGDQFPDDLIPWLSAANNIILWKTLSGLSEWSLLSLYSRVNYNYKSKYILSASFRRDGSSRFGSKNRWGSFPAVSAGWVISDEDFAKGLPAVNYLKLRAEYGVTGNFNIGNYAQFGNISSANYVFGDALAAGSARTSVGNNNLTWETTKGIDIGLDVAAFHDRLALSFDYYSKSTVSMLYQTDIPWATGFSNIQDNIGDFHFWGYEVGLNTRNLVGSFKWNTNFNISIDRNEAIKLGVNNEPIWSPEDPYIINCSRTAVGHPLGLFYGFVSDGVYMTQQEFDTQPKEATSQVGTVRFKDVNGDGVIDMNDRTYIGNPNPKFTFGLTNTFTYKNFDLNIIMSGAYRQDKARTILEWSEILEGNFNVEKYVIDRWRSLDNPGAGIIPRSLSGTVVLAESAQSRWIEDASYLTIKNITLGYTLPKIQYVSKARVFVTIQQALVLTKYKGANPEASRNQLNGLNQGLDESAYPVARAFAFGLDFRF